MGKVVSSKFLSHHFNEHINPFIRENKKIISQFIFTLFFIILGIWFIKHERAELNNVVVILSAARWIWVLAGIVLTGIYIILQGQMYVFAFAANGCKVSLFDSTILFIKRNLISVFLPAGGIASYAFFTKKIESKGIRKSQILFASTLYGFVGILTVVIVALPVFVYAIIDKSIGSGEWYALLTVVLLIVASLFAYRSILNKGFIYKMLVKFIPAAEVFMNDMQNNKINKKKFLFTILTSVLIEFTGIAFLLVAMMALNCYSSIYIAVMGYIISVIFMIISPFMRGLGAIEVSMAYVLTSFGLGNTEAIAVTFLYRFFEFWMPLLIGILSFLAKLNKLLMRVLPALFLMLLGVINIFSVLTPAISERVTLLKDFLPTDLINASNYLVIFAGFFLLVTAAFMLKGLRTAWLFAIVLSVLSLIGHITKAIDFEEASVALLVILILWATRKEYYIRTNPKFRNVGMETSLILALATLVYGIVGFYLLDKKHFNVDFDVWHSIKYTFQNYFLIGSSELVPADSFARHFLSSINISGFISIVFLIYTLVRMYVPIKNVTDDELKLAKDLLNLYGKSSVDYYKTYNDKMLFFSMDKKAFVSYRISGNYAVVLENPVSENSDEMRKCVCEFDSYCYTNGLKSIYYRVPEESLELYRGLHKKSLILGQEGIVNLSTFNLDGGSKKSLRNSINKITEKNYKSIVHVPPIKDGILQKLKSVSDEWLTDTGREEIIFSQGMFSWEELKQQTLLIVENEEEKIVAFLNVIPDYVKGEATYDLIRKTKDAPGGVIDFIMVEFFNYAKSQNFNFVNLGFAPMSGITDPHTFSERSLRFAYNKIKSFSHYKGLREYKEKFEPVWYNKYLIYQHDYDLIYIPTVLSKVIKP
jgi:phosphatidylglycerol lysyltransferase